MSARTLAGPLALAVACMLVSAEVRAEEGRAALREQASQIFGVLPAEVPNEANPVTDAKVTLGRALYYDARLSKNHDIACNSCHQLDSFGVDGEATSPGHKGQRGDRNSPTVYNAALHLAQFWDGRAADVEAQAKGPVTNPIEMALARPADAEAVLRSIPGYAPLFAAAFPGEEQPVSFENMARAIGAFERRLTTPGRFDRFLQGDDEALSDAEVKGLETFLASGCTTCHMGPAMGGTMYQKLGLVHPYETEDVGREKVTGNEADRRSFKVPSLRNVAETGPWFHDGSLKDLGEVVRVMAWHQLGRELSEEEQTSIVAFLRALTGEVDATLVAKPELPESGPDTPAPDPS